MKTLSVLVLFTLLAGPTQAGEFALPWFTVDGGGGTSASADGRFALNATAGQPDAGFLASGDGRFRLSGGFWHAEATFGGCTLSITLTGGNMVVSWPCDLGGGVLETTEELRAAQLATVWRPVNPQPTGHSYTAPITGVQRFFRLRSP